MAYVALILTSLSFQIAPVCLVLAIAVCSNGNSSAYTQPLDLGCASVARALRDDCMN